MVIAIRMWKNTNRPGCFFPPDYVKFPGQIQAEDDFGKEIVEAD